MNQTQQSVEARACELLFNPYSATSCTDSILAGIGLAILAHTDAMKRIATALERKFTSV